METAFRLNEITQKIGFAVWQLQELECVSAKYFVLVAQAEKGMGEVTCGKLVEKAIKETFGRTIHKIAKEGILSTELENRFHNLLSERNWLIHRSRADSWAAIHSNKAMDILVNRIDAIGKESLSLLYETQHLSMNFINKQNVTKEYIHRKAGELLQQWHKSESI